MKSHIYNGQNYLPSLPTFFSFTFSLINTKTNTMPATATENTSFIHRSINSIRRNQIASIMEPSQEHELQDMELFQKHISDRFHLLSSTTPEENLLSVEWLRKLLDMFLCCEAEFKAVLILHRDPSHITKSPLDRLIPELLDRTVKALDFCNAVNFGIESICHLQKLAEIAYQVLDKKPLSEGHVKRAKKALSSMMAGLTGEEKECGGSAKATERAWSFGRRGGSGSGAGNVARDRNLVSFRSFSLSVSKNWSAAKQIQAMSANLTMPRGGESTGLALPVYIMSTVLVFVMWTLVTAIPCQDRSNLPTHFPIPRQTTWAGPISGLQEKIAEEWKKKEKKGSAGLLEETQRLEKCGQALIDLADSVQFPLEEEKEEEFAVQVAELGEICKKMEEGLVPLRLQVRELFHRIVRSRAEVLELLEQTSKSSSLLV